MLYVSCDRQLPKPQAGISASVEQQEPSTPAEKELVRKIRDVASVLNAIYDDPEVVAEVNAAIASRYYEDERVLLADLLFPEKSELYRFMQKKQVESGNGETLLRGAFSRRFKAAAPGLLSKQRTEGILTAARSHGQPLLRNVEGTPVVSGSALSIYHPYSEDFLPGEHPLAVAATVEADWLDVPDPDCPLSHVHTGAGCNTIRIDESYVQKHPVHIIGSGTRQAAGPSEKVLLSSRPRRPRSPRAPGEPSAQQASVSLIYLGKVKCTRQYDRLFSFTGNGGGSELKFIRGEGYITLNNNQQVSGTEFDVVSVYFRRRDIRREREKYVYAIWDPNWEPERTEQVFGIYEEDTQGEREFSGSVDTEIKHPGGETSITPVSYSFSVKTQDNIIRQINWARGSFFRYNRSGLSGCGLRNGYSWYDCRLPVAYSLPER